MRVQPHRVQGHDHFLEHEAKGTKVVGAHSKSRSSALLLKRPRKVMLMVKAGSAVDDFIAQLLPLLQPGDLIIDGGNSHFPDTNRRCREAWRPRGLLYVGWRRGNPAARKARALRPVPDAGRSSDAAWPHIKPIFKRSKPPRPTVSRAATGSARAAQGHYVKMVHNGIEYGDMQLIGENAVSSAARLRGPELRSDGRRVYRVEPRRSSTPS